MSLEVSFSVPGQAPQLTLSQETLIRDWLQRWLDESVTVRNIVGSGTRIKVEYKDEDGPAIAAAEIKSLRERIIHLSPDDVGHG